MNAHEKEVINNAISILNKYVLNTQYNATSPSLVRDYLRLNLEPLEHEVFAVLMLSNAHNVIDFKVLFRGTINSASVHPREVVKEALASNAASVVLCHNHPSGCSNPSEADKAITKRLKDALDLVDIRVLDHIVVGSDEMTSFAELGLI